MRKFLTTLFTALALTVGAFGADAANDVVISQRNAGNTGFIQRNVGASGAITNAATFRTQLGIQPTITFGAGVEAALGVNVGTAGAPVVNGGALGTPSSGTATNLTGTSGITGTGALNSGSITSGFGSIDVGADSITGGAISGTTGTFSDNLTLSGSGKYILGDWTNAIATRPAFKTNVTNGATYLHAVPDGTGTQSALSLFGTSDIATNVLRMIMLARSDTPTPSGSINIVNSGTVGAANFLLQFNGTTAATFTSTGLNNTVIGATTPAAGSFTTLSATGQISKSNTAGADSVFLVSGSTTTGANTLVMTSTGGTYYFGVENSAGSYLAMTPYDLGYYLPSGRGLSTYIVGTGVVTRTSSTGLAVTGDLSATGALSKGSGTFKIDHPLASKSASHYLVHSFIEGPRADLIYRGTVTLADGSATVDIDAAVGMTAGTFTALATNPQVWLQNADGWTPVRGRVDGATLTITAKDAVTETVSWLVIAERHDPNIKATSWTDANGKPILEPEKIVDLAESKKQGQRVLKPVKPVPAKLEAAPVK